MNENKVHFYITCGLNPIKEIIYVLWLGKPIIQNQEYGKEAKQVEYLNIIELFLTMELNMPILLI